MDFGIEKIINLILFFIFCSSVSCAHKIIAKNCEQTTGQTYWVCDGVIFK